MEKKEMVILIICIIIMLLLIPIGINRFEKINNGEMVLVNHNDADE